MKNLDEASESLTRAKRLLGDTDSSCSIEGALLAIDLDDIHAATRYIDAAEIQGSGPTIAYVRETLQSNQGMLNAPLRCTPETLNERPKHIRARLNRISCYLGLDQAVEAKDDANILLSSPQNSPLLFAKADAQSRLGEWEEAKEGFLAVLEQASSSPYGSHKIGCMLPRLDRPERAEGPINEALRLAPDHADAWHQRGMLYLSWASMRLHSATLRQPFVQMETTSMHVFTAAIHHASKNIE